MSAEIKELSPDAEIELIAGSGGIFDVKVDGALIYTKADSGNFPKPGQIKEILG